MYYPKHRYYYGSKYRYGYRPYFSPRFYRYYGLYPLYYYREHSSHRTERAYRNPRGAVDLNIKPKDAEVYIDGRLVGNVREFDGWPQYLWLDEGTHELIVYKPGYQTLVREIEVDRYDVFRLRYKMLRGTAEPPEVISQVEKKPKTYGAPAAGPTPSAPEPPVYSAPPPRYGHQAPAPSGALDTRADPGRLYLQVTPPDAAVYLDGGFLGLGKELSELELGLLLTPGEHVLQVMHPQREPRELTFEIVPGSEERLEIGLDG